MSRLLSILIAFCVMLPLASAQQPASNSSSEATTKKRSFRVLCYFKVKNLSELYYKHRETITPVELSRMNFSEPYPMGKVEELTFGLPQQIDGEEKFKPLLSVKVPQRIKKAVVLILPPTAESKAPFSCKIIDFSDNKMKLGESILYNVSDTTIAGKISEEKIYVRPGLSKRITKFGNTDATGHYPINLYTVKSDKVRPLARARWYHRDEVCSLILVVNSQKRTRLISFPVF